MLVADPKSVRERIDNALELLTSTRLLDNFTFHGSKWLLY